MSETTTAAAFAEPAAVEAADGGWTVTLDGKPLTTPAGNALAIRSRELATAISAEWRGVMPRKKGAKADFERVPLTRILATAIDRLPTRRAAVIDELMAHAETELLCYRAAQPRDLAARQAAVWQPLLDWLALAYDARLENHTNLLPPDQPAGSLAALRHALEKFDDLKLAGLGVVVAATGSLVLGLALADGHIDAEAAFAAAELDRLYQIERWGEDPVLSAKQAEIKADLSDAQRFLRLALA